MHTAAREMVYVAEQGLMADGKNTLDPTWQEMLNHATAKVKTTKVLSKPSVSQRWETSAQFINMDKKRKAWTV